MEQGFAVVLVAGLAVFGLMFLASESEIGPSSTPSEDRIILTDKNIGSVGGAETDVRTIPFRSFTVGEARGNIQAYTEEKITISNRLFGGDSIHVRYNATQPKGGQANFEVLGRRNEGKIWVKVNGKNVFKAATVSGATPEINFSGENLRPGMNNIKIGTTKGDWFSPASYRLEEVEVTVNDRKFHDYQTSFELYQHELNNFAGGNLTFAIPVDSSRPEKPLKIEINGNKIYSETNVRSTQEVSISKREADLTPGFNTIDFDTDGQAMYKIENPEIVMRYYGTTTPGTVRTEFSTTAGQLSYARKKNTEEVIKFDYQNNLPSNNPLEILLNEKRYSVSPLNGENEIEIDAEDLKRENTVIINSNGSFSMQNLQVVSRKVEK